MRITRTLNLLVAVLACLLWAMTTHAQQVPIPRSAAEVPGPVAGTAMTKEYVQMVGRTVISMKNDWKFIFPFETR